VPDLVLPIENVAKGGGGIKEQHQIVITKGLGILGKEASPRKFLFNVTPAVTRQIFSATIV
jgi:hypothetical protein